MLAEKGLDGLGPVFQSVLNEAMKIERSEYLQADPYERSPTRRGQANGFKDKTVLTRTGALELNIPQVRDSSFYPKSLEKGCRSEMALKLALAEMYVTGVSTRKVAQITERLCGKDVSSTHVSNMAKLLDEELAKFRDRPLGEFPFVFVDAQYQRIRHDGIVRSLAVLIAIGINPQGFRELIGVSVSLSEAEVHWRKFFQSLTQRGLSGVKLIISDDHTGLGCARSAVFPSVPWQRCQFHLSQNAQAYAPSVGMRPEIGQAMRDVAFGFFCLAPSAESAILIGKHDSSGHFVPLDKNDPLFNRAYETMATNQWPTLEEQSEWLEGTGQTPHGKTEEEYLAAKLKKDCEKAHLDCSQLALTWIPPTIWDLSIVSSNARHDLEYSERRCGIVAETSDTFKVHESSKYFACLQASVVEVLDQVGFKLQRGEHLDSTKVKQMANALLVNIDHKLSGEKLSGTAKILKFRVEGHAAKAKKGKPNLFTAVVDEELDAYRSNKVVLWRATDGIKLKAIEPVAKASRQVIPGPDEITKVLGHLGSSSCSQTEGSQNCTAPRLLEDATDDRGAFDFPARITKDSKPLNDLPSFKDLSFANSLLAGLYYDSQGKSACSFAYIHPLSGGTPSQYFYRLTLDRGDFNSKSAVHTFSTGNIPPWFGIFGRYESFHPRSDYFVEGEDQNIRLGLMTSTGPTQDQTIRKSLRISKLLSSGNAKLMWVTQFDSNWHNVGLDPARVHEEEKKLQDAQRALTSWWEKRCPTPF